MTERPAPPPTPPEQASGAAPAAPDDTVAEPGAQPGPLAAVTAEIEQHVADGGWDQPPRLFALVGVDDLLAAAPDVAAAMGLDGSTPGALVGIEQESFPPGPLDEVLATVAWGPEVAGCALVHEVVVLPPGAPDELPAGADPAAWAVGHPQRRDVRMAVAVLREGGRASVLRVRDDLAEGADGGGVVLAGPDLAPKLAEALAATLAD